MRFEMENMIFKSKELIDIVANSSSLEESNVLINFLSRNDAQILPAKIFDRETVLPTLRIREWTMGRAHLPIKGLSNLILTLNRNRNPLLSISFDHPSYIGFLVLEPSSKTVQGFMLLEKSQDAEKRRTAFRPDGSYEEY